MTLFSFNDKDASVVNLRCVAAASRWMSNQGFVGSSEPRYLIGVSLIGNTYLNNFEYDSVETRDAAYARLVDKLGELWV